MGIFQSQLPIYKYMGHFHLNATVASWCARLIVCGLQLRLYPILSLLNPFCDRFVRHKTYLYFLSLLNSAKVHVADIRPRGWMWPRLACKLYYVKLPHVVYRSKLARETNFAVKWFTLDKLCLAWRQFSFDQPVRFCKYHLSNRTRSCYIIQWGPCLPKAIRLSETNKHLWTELQRDPLFNITTKVLNENPYQLPDI